MMNNINVCLICDENYFKFASVTVASILKNAKDDENLFFHIVNDGISENSKLKLSALNKIKKFKVRFIEVNKKDFEIFKQIKTFKHVSDATWYRLKLPSILNDIDKVIYLDCDVIVNVPLSVLFNIDLKDYYLAGVSDIDAPYSGYVNAGVLVFNLDLMRKDNIEDKFLNFALNKKDKITLADQEIINETLKNKIKLIFDKSLNVQSGIFYKRSYFTRHPKIIHYIGKYKPWSRVSLCYYKKNYFEYLGLTPWKKGKFELFIQKYIIEFLSYLKFIVKKPSFFLNPKFYAAIYKTYFRQDCTYFSADDFEVLILTKNRKKFLSEAIKSVLYQTVKGFKITVVDNGSDYDVNEVINKYENSNIKCFKQNKQVDVTENIKTAAELADRNYVLIMHDDDILHPQFVECVLYAIQNNNNVDVVCPKTVEFNSREKIKTKHYDKIKYQVLDREKFISKIFINKIGSNFVFPSVVYKKENIKNALSDIEIKKAGTIGDNVIMADALTKGVCVYIENPLYYYRNHKKQESKVLKLHNSEIISFLLFFKEKLNLNLYTKTVFNIFSYYRLIQLYKHFGLYNSSLFELKEQAYKCGALNDWGYAMFETYGLPFRFLNYLFKRKFQNVSHKKESLYVKGGFTQ